MTLQVREPEHLRHIKLEWSDERVLHDEHATESEMRSQCPTFFRTPHGKRETMTFYRGFIIIRNTRTYSDRSTERCTQLYIYLRNPNGGGADTLHVNDPGRSVKSAKRVVDRILATRHLDPSQAPELPGVPTLETLVEQAPADWQQALRAALDPFDRAPWLVYADWLEERGGDGRPIRERVAGLQGVPPDV